MLSNKEVIYNSKLDIINNDKCNLTYQQPHGLHVFKRENKLSYSFFFKTKWMPQTSKNELSMTKIKY